MSEIKVTGAKTLARALLDAGVSVEDLVKVNSEVAQIVTELARVLAPRRTGALAASGRTRASKLRASAVFGSAAVKYAAPIHWGIPARGIAAQPYASDARDRTEGRWTREYEKELERIVAEVEQHSG
jgi:hypothetical protein